MAIAGLVNTTVFDTPSGRRPQNFREGILRMYARGGMNKALLLALTTVMKTKPTTDPLFHWFTKQMQDRRLRLGADMLASGGGDHEAGDVENITVDSAFCSAQSLKEGDRLYVEETGEILYVNATPTTGSTISVIRGFSATAGAAQLGVDYDGANVNPYLKVIGSAYEEGSMAPDPVSFDPQELINYTQIFRQTYGLTNTAAATDTRTGPEEAEAKRDALELFGMDMEMAFWFGRKAVTIRNGHPLRQTDGVISFIPQNRKWAPEDGIITPDWLDGISEELFRYGSEEKMVMAGNTFLTALSRMVRKSGEAKYELSEQVSEYGIGGIRRLITPNGTLVLKAHPLFSQMTGGANPTTAGGSFTSMSNAAVILDMANLTYRPLKGRDVKFEPNLQLPGEDAKRAGWLAEAGLELNHPYTFGMITGVKTGRDDIADDA